MQHNSSAPDRCVAIGGMVPEREYLDDRELARRTPLARATWQKMRHEGKGPPVRRVGRRCLYLWSEVVAWIESQRSAA